MSSLERDSRVTTGNSARLPGPRGKITGDSLLFFRREPEAFLRLARRHSDVVSFKVGPQRVFFFNHPEQVRELLVLKAASFVKVYGSQPGGAPGEGLLTLEGKRIMPSVAVSSLPSTAIGLLKRPR